MADRLKQIQRFDEYTAVGLSKIGKTPDEIGMFLDDIHAHPLAESYDNHRLFAITTGSLAVEGDEYAQRAKESAQNNADLLGSTILPPELLGG